MNDSAKIIQRFLASLDPEDVNAAQAFLLGYLAQVAGAEAASVAVRHARQTLDRIAAARSLADQFPHAQQLAG